MLPLVIVGCEIAFWVLLGAGLAARYLLRRRRTGTALLVGTALTDLVLLTAAVLDLRSGATAGWQHGLAAAYLGYSIVFGRRTVRWADRRFAHRFAGGPPPWRPPAHGPARVRYEWGVSLRITLAYGIACALLLAVIRTVDDPARTMALTDFLAGTARIPAIALLWAAGFTLWSWRARGGRPAAAPAARPGQEPARAAQEAVRAGHGQEK